MLLGLTGIILGGEPANGGRRNGAPHWPSPHPIWSLSRGVPITRSNVTRCFWHIYNKAVQLTHWNTVKVTEHNSIQHDNEIFAPWYIGSTGIILGAGPANGGRRNGAPHWPSPHPIVVHIHVWEMAGVTAMAAGGEQTQSAHVCDP